MTRISKSPDIRRGELLETADRLFTENGFASVRVSDIVSAMGVAQGTFYYYFKSKEEILTALLEQKWAQIAAYINVTASAGPDAVARLTTVLTCMVKPGDDIKSSPGNRLLSDPAVAGAFHSEFDNARIKSLLPVMQSVVEYGIEKGAFPRFSNTNEVVSIVFLGISAYLHHAATEHLPPAVPAVSETVERILGLPAGTININISQ
jgi:AcrR family transcriptional regulator